MTLDRGNERAVGVQRLLVCIDRHYSVTLAKELLLAVGLHPEIGRFENHQVIERWRSRVKYGHHII